MTLFHGFHPLRSGQANPVIASSAKVLRSAVQGSRESRGEPWTALLVPSESPARVGMVWDLVPFVVSPCYL